MKTHKMMMMIHKYGMYYSLFLYILVLSHIGIYPNQIDFWLILFCFCLNIYFIFHKGMVYAIGKQNDFESFKREMIKAIAEKTHQEIQDEMEEDEEENRLN